MAHWLRWGWPRRYIVRAAAWWWPRDPPAWVLDWLYPDDCVISFGGEDADGD